MGHTKVVMIVPPVVLNSDEGTSRPPMLNPDPNILVNAARKIVQDLAPRLAVVGNGDSDASS